MNKKPNRVNKLGFRCNDKELGLIERSASLENLPTATYLRKLALDDAKAKGFSLTK